MTDDNKNKQFNKDSNMNQRDNKGEESTERNKTGQDFTSENRDVNRMGGEAGGEISNPNKNMGNKDVTRDNQTSSDWNKNKDKDKK